MVCPIIASAGSQPAADPRVWQFGWRCCDASVRQIGRGARLALLLHHDDADREFAYDREFRFSPLAKALDRAAEFGIDAVSMKRDWKTVFV
jgi:hypothetical protein